MYNVSLRAVVCFFQAEDGIRDLVRSRGLGDVYKRQLENRNEAAGSEGVGRCDESLRHPGEPLPGQPHALSLIHI